MTPDTLKAFRVSLGLSLAGFSAYSGVPVHTLRKWETGERKPDSASARYLELLETIARDWPGLNLSLLERVSCQPATLAPAAPKKAATRRSGKPAAAQSANPEPPQPPADPALPDWLAAGGA